MAIFKRTIIRVLVCSILFPAPVMAQSDPLRDAIVEDIRANVTDQITMIQAFFEANTLDCIELYLEGICLWFRLSCGFTGCSVSIIPTPRISHYNPDFVVTSYSRIGASPVAEIDRLYDGIQTEASRGVLDLVSSHDVPRAYRQEHQYGGANIHQSGSEEVPYSTGSGVIYSEVEVIGHPGNLISTAARVMTGTVTGDVGAVMTDQLAGMATIARQSVTQVGQVTGEILGGGPNVIDGELGDTGEWSGNPALGDVDAWVDNIMQPVDTAITGLLSEITAAYGDINIAINQFESGALGDQAQDILSGPGDFLESYVTELDIYENISDDLEVLGSATSFGDEAIGTVLEDGFTGEAAENILTDYQDSGFEISGEQAEEFEQIGTSIQETMDSGALTLEIGGESIDMSGGMTYFCPSDTSPLTPYYLSGLNVLGWRMQLPEMVYPQSYAFPLPDSELFIGKFSGGSLAPPPGTSFPVTLPDWSTWGNIYPRSGLVMQSDEAKARAVSAFRAAHVVTRPGQSHIYTHAAPRGIPGLEVVHPEPLDPNRRETGAFQMLYPEKSEQCTTMQDSGLNPGITIPRDTELTSDNGSYVWAMWRQYECCSRPTSGFVSKIADIDFRVRIL